MYVSIIETKNNIFVNISTRQKKLVFQASGGMLQLRGKKRRTPLAGELLGKLLMERLQKLKVRQVGFSVHGPFNNIVRSVFRGIMINKKRNMKFRFVESAKGIAHNGVRLKKQRRL